MNMRKLITLSFPLLLLAGCAGSAPPADAASSERTAATRGAGIAERAAELPEHIRPFLPRARELAASMIIIDTHVDVPWGLEGEWADVTVSQPDRDWDLPRSEAGGLDAPFMSIYIPADVDAADEGGALAERLMDYVARTVANAPDRLAIAYTPADVVNNHRRGITSLPMGMENGGPIRRVEDVAHYQRRGIRYVSLAHSRSNGLSDSSYDINERWNGLSPLGRDVVVALNEQGIMVDISHLSDKAAYQVLELTAVPVIASHSSARHFVPGFQRNIDDDMLEAIAANGGVVQVNFGSTFISLASRRSSEQVRIAFQQHLNATGLAPDSEEAQAWLTEYRAAHPFRRATLDEVLDHFDHIAGVAGIDHVGIGSDYDGVGDTLPINLMDVASYPHLIAGLLSRGYTEDDIQKILGGNLLRVWRAADAYARGVDAQALAAGDR